MTDTSKRNSRIRSRKPTGAVAHPLVLIYGPEGTGKSWAALALSASPRVGSTYVIDLGEGTSDEYGGIPGADFELITHDGTYHDIADQLDAVHEEATRANQAGEPPVVLVVDSMTHLWGMLKDWTTRRASQTKANQKKLRENPDSEIDVSQNFWNDANARHKRIVTKFLTFPGIVVVTARGGEVSEVDRDGKPTGEKIWRVEANKNLPYDASLIVRMDLGQQPVITKARSIHAPVHPQERPKPVPDFSLDRVIFDVLHYDPAGAAALDVTELTAGELTNEERRVESEQTRDQRPAQASSSTRGNGGGQQFQPEQDSTSTEAQALANEAAEISTPDGLKDVWHRAQNAGLLHTQVTVAGAGSGKLGEYVKYRARSIKEAEEQDSAEADADQPAPADTSSETTPGGEEPVDDSDAPTTEEQLQQVAIELGNCQVPTSDRDTRLHYISALTSRPVASMKDLTRAEADDLVQALRDIQHNENPAAALGDVAQIYASRTMEGAAA